MTARFQPSTVFLQRIKRVNAAWLATFPILALVGCTSGGGNALFPNDHRLLPAAKDVAASMRPSDPRELSKMALEAFYVQPGDVLLLEVIDLESDIRLPADQTVMVDGTIDLGEYGRIVVAGMTVEQIEVAVTAAVQSLHRDVTIKPINVRLNVAESAVYYVLGEVNAPGSYPLIGRETVLDGIVTAGGLSDRASECQVILSRPTPPGSCRIVLPVCYDRVVQLGDTTTNYQLRPGDRIYVGTRTFCEAVKFWKTGCDRCPAGACPCRGSLTPAVSPYPVNEETVEIVPESIVPPARSEEAPAPMPTPELPTSRSDSADPSLAKRKIGM